MIDTDSVESPVNCNDMLPKENSYFLQRPRLKGLRTLLVFPICAFSLVADDLPTMFVSATSYPPI